MITINYEQQASNSAFSTWLCCQLGAREHYAIPRALHRQGQLVGLITDTWIKPNSSLNWLPQSLFTNLRERFHPELAEASVSSFNQSLFQFELTQKIRQIAGWNKIIARNYWFQEQALEVLRQYTSQINSKITIFAYSYAALKLFRYAKMQGWRTVLGQIDPGILEEKIVKQEYLKHREYKSFWQSAPSQYWTDWQEECRLADSILVNSLWSSQALQKVGIAKKKIEIVPLAYQVPEYAQNFVKTYPTAFTPQRPLRVLFLGQIILRKGIAAIIQAAELLKDEPIEFWFVGSSNLAQIQDINNQKIKWLGAVPRSITTKYYQEADIFLFPTLSDGFGLTQLEAQAWQLPIIASQFCGEVVKNKINGLILENVTTEAIVQALKFCQQNPQQLQEFANQSQISSDFSLQKLSNRLHAVTHGSI